MCVCVCVCVCVRVCVRVRVRCVRAHVGLHSMLYVIKHNFESAYECYSKYRWLFKFQRSIYT